MTTRPGSADHLFTLKQAARITGFRLTTLYHWAQSGRLQIYRTTGFIYSWLTTLDNVDLAAQNTVTERQRQANVVAHQLMQEFSLRRAGEWAEASP